jgi:hypothetical protein
LKLNAHRKLIVFAGLALLLAACQLTIAPIPPAEQSSSPLPQGESPLAMGSNRLDSVASYHATLQREERYFQPDGSFRGGITESHYYWTRSEGPYGYNEHQILTLRDWETETPGVMGESYLVDDLAFTNCVSCPPDRAGWSVTKRNEGIPLGGTVAPQGDALWRIAGISNAELLAQRVVIGDESINGLTATHYRLIEDQISSEMIRMRLGGAPDSPLEVAIAQMDIWLTVGDQQLIQYTLQVEGTMELIAGTQVLQPFIYSEQYSVTEINSSMTITVPSEVLDAVEPQLRELEK